MMNSDSSGAVIMPPIIGVAIRLITSEPAPFRSFLSRVAPSRQRKGEGRGIGLAIVKSIVIAHQGKVSVTSDTRYSFYFDITQTPPLNCSDSERRYH